MFKQFTNFFKKTTVNTDNKEETKMAQLPDFNSLQQNKKAGLPSFAELQAKKAIPTETIKTSEQPAVLPSFSELAKAQQGGKKDAKKKVKGANKRVRLAKVLDVFKQTVGNTGHAYFYRYLRLADEKNDGLAGPKGGACILVNMLSSIEFVFSFSICSKEDVFVKDESRRLCQERFTQNIRVKVLRRDPSASCYENIERAITNYFLSVSKNPDERAAHETTGPIIVLQSPKVTKAQLKLLVEYINNLYYTTA